MYIASSLSHYNPGSESVNLCGVHYNVDTVYRAFARPEFLLATFPKIWNF
jgi:hypothetical protein